MCMLPVRCKGCEVVFDLWHVLQEQEQKREVRFSRNNEFENFLKQSLCWRCQQIILEEPTEEPDEGGDAEGYQMTLNFE